MQHCEVVIPNLVSLIVTYNTADTHCLRCNLVGYLYTAATQSCLPSSVLLQFVCYDQEESEDVELSITSDSDDSSGIMLRQHLKALVSNSGCSRLWQRFSANPLFDPSQFIFDLIRNMVFIIWISFNVLGLQWRLICHRFKEQLLCMQLHHGVTRHKVCQRIQVKLGKLHRLWIIRQFQRFHHTGIFVLKDYFSNFSNLSLSNGHTHFSTCHHLDRTEFLSAHSLFYCYLLQMTLCFEIHERDLAWVGFGTAA